ncbi:MAG: ribonuclease P protein component [Chloroflexi bacterium]|nr:ribonuclease P protein component [Chloroflexota bacterium]
MKRRYRLRKRRDFERLYREGQAYVHPLVVLRVAPNDVGHPRIGITVSRAVGKAVHRNKVKRRLREIMRLRLNQLAPGYDYWLIARPPSAAVSYWALDDAVTSLLQRAGLLYPTFTHEDGHEQHEARA